MATHVSALLHAAVLLGLVWAARLSTLGPGWQDVAAWLAVVCSALIAAKDTFNWLTGVQDEFAEKPKTAASLGALGASGEQLVSAGECALPTGPPATRCNDFGLRGIARGELPDGLDGRGWHRAA
jgi:hypothetical protein